MRQVVDVVTFCGAVLLAVLLPAAEVSAAPAPVMMSQVIRPLTCTVDVVTDGSNLNINLSPAKCSHSSKARKLLAEARASIGAQGSVTQHASNLTYVYTAESIKTL